MASTQCKLSKTRDKIIISKLFRNKYQKEGTLTVELKQTVHSSVTYPPKKSVADRSLDNPFFNEPEKGKTFTRSKTYVAFLDVDEELNIEGVQKILDKFPNSIIYKILSNHPILDSTQQTYYDSLEDKIEKQQYYDVIANQQLIQRHGSIILDGNGKPQYLATYFSTTFIEDIDLRTKLITDYYSNTFVEKCISIRDLNKSNILL